MGRSRGELSNAISRGSKRPLVLEVAGGSDPTLPPPGGRGCANSPGGAGLKLSSFALSIVDKFSFRLTLN